MVCSQIRQGCASVGWAPTKWHSSPSGLHVLSCGCSLSSGSHLDRHMGVDGYMYRTCKCLWGAPTNLDSSPQVGYMSSDVGVPFLVGLILIDTWEWMQRIVNVCLVSNFNFHSMDVWSLFLGILGLFHSPN